MRVYLDNCSYNRPFEPQNQLRVAIETSAKMRIQALMRSGQIEYAWSAALDYEVGKKLGNLGQMRIANPVDFIMEDDL